MGKELKKQLLLKALLLGGCLFSLFTCLPAFGQPLRESIIVEGKYEPEVIPAERLNVFPTVPEMQVYVDELDYAPLTGAVDFRPLLYTQPATWSGKRFEFDTIPGYLTLGIGSWLNTTLSAGYNIRFNSDFRGGIRLQHNSTSLWQPRPMDIKADGKQFRYDEAVGIYGSWTAKEKGFLNFAIDYCPGFFNYYGVVDPFRQPSLFSSPFSSGAADLYETENSQPRQPHQTLNDLRIGVEWLSALNRAKSGRFNAGLSMRYFAYRTLPLPEFYSGQPVKGNRETDLQLDLTGVLAWGNGELGLDARLNTLFYSGPDELFSYITETGGLHLRHTLGKPDNYGNLALHPRFSWKPYGVEVSLGAAIDLTARAGLPGNRYPFFHIAPEIRTGFRIKKVSLRLDVTGGSTLNTLAYLHQFDYYGMPALTTTRPSYTPLDALFSMDFGHFSGFSFGMGLRFKVTRDVPLGGWYQSWLSYGWQPMPALETVAPEGMAYSLADKGMDIHGLRVEGHAEYSLDTRLQIEARAAWQPQKGKIGFFDGFDRPRVTADFAVRCSPVKPLTIGIEYNYRGVRKIFGRTLTSPLTWGGMIGDDPDGEIVGMRLPDLTMLGIEARWKFSGLFDVWLRGQNLLNRHDAILPMQPMQGISFLAGFDWKF